jgi:hypothetical protein
LLFTGEVYLAGGEDFSDKVTLTSALIKEEAPSSPAK